MIDASHYFLEENQRAQLTTRRTGLGTMGLADALLLLGVRYGSKESLEVIEGIYRTIRDAAYESSCELAAEKGAFPRFDREKYRQGAFIRQLPLDLQEKIARQGIRNAVLLAQAPTGTTSLLAGVSSGIEPIFDFVTLRRDRLGEHLIAHPLYQCWKLAHPRDALPDHFVTAADLTPEEHVLVQATIQRYTDASMSKTVNAPNRHTIPEVDVLYSLAFELGCKGITYYRDGSRDGVLNRVDHTLDETPTSTHPTPRLRSRPSVLHGATYRVPTPVGTAFVTINTEESGQVREIFVTVGRAGSDVAADAEAIGRLVSLVLRIPTDLGSESLVEAVIDQLAGIGGRRALGFGPHQVRSLADGVAHALIAYVGQRESLPSPRPDGLHSERSADASSDVPWAATRLADLCPQCGQAALVAESGCVTCHGCGYSAC